MINNNILIKHRLLLDPKSYTEKPSSKETGLINQRLLNNSVEANVWELAEASGNNGQAWTPAYFINTRDADGWVGESILGLDFDNKDKKTKLRVENPISFQQVKVRLSEYNLDCVFAYNTLSHTEDWHRFRVVFSLNQCIVDRKYHGQIILALLELFPEADQAPKSLATIFYGGKNLIYTNYDYCLDLTKLFDVAQFYSVRNSSSKNMNRDLYRIKNKLGTSENGSNQNTPYISNIETVENASNSAFTNRKINMVRSVNFEDLKKEVKILEDLMNPNKKLIHDTLVGLATNLRYIEGGQELFRRCIDANPDYEHSEKHLIMTYCKNRDYFPMSLEKFSPYEEDWEYGNLLNASRKKGIIRLSKEKTMSVEESRKKLKDTFESIYSSDDTFIHVIKAFTGIGKTELYGELENVLIALPYHSLKNEVAVERMKVKHRQTPSLDKLPSDVRDTLDYYYSIGAFAWASQYLTDTSKIYESVKQYRDECLVCYSSDSTVLTTHQKAIFIPSWIHKTIIFDEDMISSLMPTGKVTMNDLLRLEDSISNTSDKRTLSSLIDDIREGGVNTPKEMDMSIFENFSEIEDEVLGSSIKYESNILNFFDSKYFVLDSHDAATIHYVRKYDLPLDKKIIVLSATADETIYRHLFADRLRFYDISNVEPVGLIEQDTKYSFSQSSFLRHSNYVVEKVSDLPVITFSRFKSLFFNPVQEMHFGYCSGSDKYNGQDMAVAGTPHVSPITIALYAKALGIPMEPDEFLRVRQQNTYHNGFRFWFNTYDNEYLRSIQFYFIETGLKQAIGRARPYTTNSIVKVYSNYPLPESSIGIEEQDLGRERLEESKKAHLEECLKASTLDLEVTSID